MVNGEQRDVADAMTAQELLTDLKLDPAKVALERNREIVPRSAYGSTRISDGDVLEIVHFIGGGNFAEPDDDLVVAGRKLRSRLIVGTGKYKDFEETRAAIEASGAEMVTVAVRRVNISDPTKPMLVDYVDPKKYTYLPEHRRLLHRRRCRAHAAARARGRWLDVGEARSAGRPEDALSRTWSRRSPPPKR